MKCNQLYKHHLFSPLVKILLNGQNLCQKFPQNNQGATPPISITTVKVVKLEKITSRVNNFSNVTFTAYC